MTVKSASVMAANPESVKDIVDVAKAEGFFSKRELKRLGDGYVSRYDLKEASKLCDEIVEKASSYSPEQFAQKEMAALLILSGVELAYGGQSNLRCVRENVKDFFGRLINGK